MRNKILMLTCVFLSMALLMSACQQVEPETVTVVETVKVQVEVTPVPEEAGPVKITFWTAYSPLESELLEQELIPAFESEHPGIQVEHLALTHDDLRTKLITSIAGGTAPDLIRADIIWVPELANMGALAKLDEVMSDFQIFSDAVFPGPLATNYFKGSYYGQIGRASCRERV